MFSKTVVADPGLELTDIKQLYTFCEERFSGWRGRTFWKFKFFEDSTFEELLGNRDLEEVEQKLRVGKKGGQFKFKNVKQGSKPVNIIPNLKQFQSLKIQCVQNFEYRAKIWSLFDTFRIL